MKGQIKYSYIFGLFVFMIGLLFGTDIIIRILPTYTSAIRKKNLDMVADSVITLLSKDPGYWSNGASYGTDWENHPGYTKRIGFAQGNLLNKSKIDAAKNLDYTNLSKRIGISKRRVFIKVVLNTTSESCDSANVTCIGIRPSGEVDTGVREERVLVKIGRIINGKLRVTVW